MIKNTILIPKNYRYIGISYSSPFTSAGIKLVSDVKYFGMGYRFFTIERERENKEPLGFIPKNITNVYFDLEGISLDNLKNNIGKDLK